MDTFFLDQRSDQNNLRLIKQIKCCKLDQKTKERIYSIYLSYISFNTNAHNATINDKIEVSEIFAGKFVSDLYRETDEETKKRPFHFIENSVQFLVDYCLSFPTTNWKEDHLVDLVTQYFILDIGQKQQILEIFEKATRMTSSIVVRTKLMFRLLKSYNWHIFRYLSRLNANKIFLKKHCFYIYQSMILQ